MSEEIRSKFVKVECPRCKNEQVIFGKSAMRVKCEKCNKLLMMPTGGKTRMRARIKEVLGWK